MLLLPFYQKEWYLKQNTDFRNIHISTVSGQALILSGNHMKFNLKHLYVIYVIVFKSYMFFKLFTVIATIKQKLTLIHQKTLSNGEPNTYFVWLVQKLRIF
jgi:hypothetical protein